jgi:phosphoglycolate phosphatase
MPASALIVFDLDGTLVDTAPDLIGALNHCLDIEGVAHVSLDDSRSLIGAGAKAMLARGLSSRDRAVSEDRFAELHRAFLAHYDAHIADRSKPFEGAVEAVERLHAAGYELAICTNKSERLAVKLLRLLDLERHFPVIVGGDTFEKQKPDPMPLRGAISRSGGDGMPAILVGDSATDLWTARATGIPLIGVTFGYTDTPMAELDPDRLIDHFARLGDAVDDLLQIAPAA